MDNTTLALAGTATVAVSSALATVLPPPVKRAGVYFYAYSLINLIAFNFGHAKNANNQ